MSTLPSPPPPPVKELRCGCIINLKAYENTKENPEPVIAPVQVCQKHQSTPLTKNDVEGGIVSDLPWTYIAIGLLIAVAVGAFYYYYGGNMKFLTDSVKAATEAVADAVPKPSA